MFRKPAIGTAIATVLGLIAAFPNNVISSQTVSPETLRMVEDGSGVAWIAASDVPMVMIHDDIVWTSGPG